MHQSRTVPGSRLRTLLGPYCMRMRRICEHTHPIRVDPRQVSPRELAIQLQPASIARGRRTKGTLGHRARGRSSTSATASGADASSAASAMLEAVELSRSSALERSVARSTRRRTTKRMRTTSLQRKRAVRPPRRDLCARTTIMTGGDDVAASNVGLDLHGSLLDLLRFCYPSYARRLLVRTLLLSAFSDHSSAHQPARTRAPSSV